MGHSRKKYINRNNKRLYWYSGAQKVSMTVTVAGVSYVGLNVVASLSHHHEDMAITIAGAEV